MPIQEKMTPEDKRRVGLSGQSRALRTEQHLGELEELILLAISGLSAKAYGAAIGKQLHEAGRTVAVGALYTTLARMEAKSLIESFRAEATRERGGRAKTYFTVTGLGQSRLEAVEVVRASLRNSRQSVVANDVRDSQRDDTVESRPACDIAVLQDDEQTTDTKIPAPPASVENSSKVAPPEIPPTFLSIYDSF